MYKTFFLDSHSPSDTESIFYYPPDMNYSAKLIQWGYVMKQKCVLYKERNYD